MRIHLKHLYFYYGHLWSTRDFSELNYIVTSENGIKTKVKITFPTDYAIRFEAYCIKDISDELFASLKDGFYNGRCIFECKWVPDKSIDKATVIEYYQDLSEMQSELTTSVGKVVKLIKFLLNQWDWIPATIDGNHKDWSLDGKTWNRIQCPNMGRMMGISILVSEENSRKIQQHLDEGFEPFVALDFLYKAKTRMIQKSGGSIQRLPQN